MEKTEFFNVHKDFAQDGQIYGHEEFFGMSFDAAEAKYHQLCNAAFLSSDPWAHIFIMSDSGVRIEETRIDRRKTPDPNLEA